MATDSVGPSAGLSMDAQVAVMQKSQQADVQKGMAALRLIDSAAISPGATGGPRRGSVIDTYA